MGTEVIPHVTSRLRLPVEYRGRGSQGRDFRESSGALDAGRGERPGRGSIGRTSSGGLEPLASRAERQERTEEAGVGRMASSQSLTGTGDAADGVVAGAAPGGRSDHIRVAVRVRPLPPGEDGIIEVAGMGAIAIRKDAATGGNEFLRSQQGRVEERMFDHVFGPDATQTEVYSWSCAPLVTEAVAKGRSATIFVYGATGAGKTYTMFGNGEREHQGLIFRAIPEVFEAIHAYTGGEGRSPCEGAGSFEVKVSFLEIYNEVLRDLLQENGGGGACRVLEDERRGVVKVANLAEAPVRTPEEALFYLRAGMQARTVEATAANSQSSRAHAVFTLTVEHVRNQVQGHGPFRRSNTELRTLHSKICLIDLAGSERAAFTQNCGSALKDGARINQSLLALANCIDALTARGRDGASTPRKKPPYRDSKLTLLLKASLTGDDLVAMIANVHPGRSHFEDSNNTLEYAKRASTVRCATRRLSRPAPPVPEDGLAACGGGVGGNSHGSYTSHMCDDDPLEECTTGTSSSSSFLPPPRTALSPHEQERLRRRRKLEQLVRARATASTNKGDCTDVTTASSPEECLSEISLSSHGGVDTGTSHDSCDLGHRSLYSEDHSDCTGKEPERPQEEDPTHSLGITAAQEERPLGAISAPSVGATGREVATNLPLALELIARLTSEKERLSARVDTVVRERNALAEDRRVLEEENDRLRASNLEKDHQLALLLARCG